MRTAEKDRRAEELSTGSIISRGQAERSEIDTRSSQAERQAKAEEQARIAEERRSKPDEWERSAAQGDAQVQTKLGYLRGKSVSSLKDFCKWIHWLRQGANQGFAGAQMAIGYCYDIGLGVPKDHSEALRWHTKAAEQGLPPAQLLAGTFYEEGRGVARDYSKAKEWYKKAADQGFEKAKSALLVLNRRLAVVMSMKLVVAGKLLAKIRYYQSKCGFSIVGDGRYSAKLRELRDVIRDYQSAHIGREAEIESMVQMAEAEGNREIHKLLLRGAPVCDVIEHELNQAQSLDSFDQLAPFFK